MFAVDGYMNFPELIHVVQSAVYYSANNVNEILKNLIHMQWKKSIQNVSHVAWILNA